MTKELNLIAADNDKLKVFVNETIHAYKSVAISLHQAACMTLFHTMQHREASALNLFFNGLRVNDQTALRVWVGEITLAPGKTDANPGEEPRTLIGWKKDTGFFVRKGMFSEGVFTLEHLLGLDPFYQKNVAKASVVDLLKLLDMLDKAAKRVGKQAEDNDIAIPPALKTLLADVGKVTAEVKATVPANDDDKAAQNSNVVNA